MSTNIHIQIGDRKFDYEGDSPLAKEDLLDAIGKLIPENDGHTETAEEFGSSLAAQPVEDEVQLHTREDIRKWEFRHANPIVLYCVCRSLLQDRNLPCHVDNTVLTGATILSFQSDNRPFTRKHLSESISRSARTFDAPWPVRFGDRVIDRAIENGLLREVGDGWLELDPGVRREIEARLER